MDIKAACAPFVGDDVRVGHGHAKTFVQAAQLTDTLGSTVKHARGQGTHTHIVLSPTPGACELRCRRTTSGVVVRHGSVIITSAAESAGWQRKTVGVQSSEQE